MNLKEFTVKGIILSSSPYGEYGKRLTILTDSLGRITAFAKGAARASSKIIGSVRPMTAAGFTLSKGKGAYNLHGVKVMDAFTELAGDPETYIYACYVLELASYLSAEGMPPDDAKDLLNLIFMTFTALRDKTPGAGLTVSIMELKLLVFQGEYTEEPAYLNEGTSGSGEARLLWREVIKLPLSRLYLGTALSISPAGAAAFKEAVKVLFKKQVPHTFLSLKMLRGEGF